MHESRPDRRRRGCWARYDERERWRVGGENGWCHAGFTNNLLEVCVHRFVTYPFLSVLTLLSIDGAALFYTTPQPSTLSLLRQYVLHFLFMPPPPPPDSPPLKYPFPFAHRPNTLDRDKIMAPAGWDTWGKIAVLRDGFDAAKWGEAWEKDLDADAGATVPGGAKDMFKSLVGEDRGSKV